MLPVVRPALKKRKTVTSVSAPFVVSCPSAIWGAGREEQIGGPFPLQERGRSNSCLCKWLHFLVTSWAEDASPCHTFSEQPEPLVNIPPPSVQRYASGGDRVPTWIKPQTSPATHGFSRSCPLFQETKAASVYPHPPRTLKKPRGSVSTSKAVLAAALEMEPDNFGYGWLVCSYGWNYCRWRRFTSSLAEWCHLRAARAEGWKKKFPALLCPCGETTSKKSRASHFWASPQMLFEKVPAAANRDGGFFAVSTSNWNQGNLWDLIL